MHRKVAAALVAALALVVSSCGESKETVTRAQLASRVEQACRDGQQTAQREIRASRSSSRDQTAYIDAILAGQKAELDAIDNFEVPDAVKADFEAFKQGVQGRIDVIERVASVDQADFARAMRAAQPEAEVASRRLSAAARTLGIEGCA